MPDNYVPRPSPPVRVTAENVERLTWTERIDKAVGSFVHWDVLPLSVRMDRAMKAAGFRGLVVEIDALAAELEATKRERDEARNASDQYRWRGPALARAEVAEAALAVAQDALQEAQEEIASAMTSLFTGPAKDGYAYTCLERAAAALAVPADTKENHA